MSEHKKSHTPRQDGERRPSANAGGKHRSNESLSRHNSRDRARPPREGGRFEHEHHSRGSDDRPMRPRVHGERDTGPDDYVSGTQKATEALIELDKDLMKLLVRRATLVSRIRGGKEHASSPAAIQAEKAVRVAWETAALAFSKDPRFSRQLFSLLQDIKVMTREQSRSLDSFNLTPPVRAVSGTITGPTSTRAAQMHAAVSASLGGALSLKTIMISSGLNDTVRAFSQVGGNIERKIGPTNLGDLTATPGKPILFADKSIFVGDDLFTLYLVVFLAIGKPGTCRLNGGGRLKGADLTALRQALPLLGARLAHVVPRSQGLPVNLESSGAIPPVVTVPGDLPYEAVCALLLGPLVWGQAVTFNLSALPASLATAALAETGPIHKAFGADVESRGPNFIYTPGPLALPQFPSLPLDPVLSAYLLALPALSGGGELTLKGRWPINLPEANETVQLLSWAGISVTVADDSVSAQANGKAFALPLASNDLSPRLGPLFLVLAVLNTKQSNRPLAIHALTPFPSDETDLELAGDFLSRLDFSLAAGALQPRAAGSEENETAGIPVDEHGRPWTSPDPYWSMAFALAAYIRSGLKLANPGNITECMPPFWSIYNSLPNPIDPAAPVRQEKEDAGDDRPARRRIIADG